MRIKIYPENPSSRHIQNVVDTLQKGGIIIYPTDTVYGLGCDIKNFKAVEKIAKIKGIDPEKNTFSFICYDISQVAEYAHLLDTTKFKLLKKSLPGPFTFILPASSDLPRLFRNKKKTIGIRIPDNNIIREIVRELGNPVMSTSIYDEDEIIEYTTDPELIHEKYQDKVDIVIDGGYGDNIPSTIVDCTGDEPVILREGKGILIL